MAGPLSSSLKSGGKDLVKELNRRLAPAVGKYSVCLTSCTCLTAWGCMPYSKRTWYNQKAKLIQDFIAERAEGTYVWTTDGQKHLDMACGKLCVHCFQDVLLYVQQSAIRYATQVLEWPPLAIATPKWSKPFKIRHSSSSLLSRTFSQPLLPW